MPNPKKKPRDKKKSAKRATKRVPPPPPPQHDIVAQARANPNPLSSLPRSFLEVPLPKPLIGSISARAGASGDPSPPDSTAIVRHFSSPLPDGLLGQCLDLFQHNMGEMYRRSNWGLDVEGKRKELQHPDARFLVVLASPPAEATAAATTAGRRNEAEGADAAPSLDCDAVSTDGHDNDTVLGFAHVRYELDDDGLVPVTYLYELQVRPLAQRLGLGKKLMTITEIITYKHNLRKVMLTVFHHNEAAMGFYRKNRYVVDESSPSNFDVEESEGCDYDYEILSKSFA